MGAQTTPATVVICCRLPARISATEFAEWERLADRSSAAVSWIVTPDRIESLEPMIDAAGAAGRIALELDAATLAARSALRTALESAAERIGPVAAVVATGSPRIADRGLLVAHGVRAVCVDGFEEVSRGSRRPAPRGWPCRSIVWGLWEVAAAAPAPGLFGRMMPWRSSPIPRAGGLSVIHLSDGGECLSRGIRPRLERMLAAVTRRRGGGPVSVPHLADLPDLITGNDQTRAGSVLRAA